MKKLMFVAAAALVGNVFAAGEITSHNIVGYQQIKIKDPLSLLAPTFKGVTESLDLTEIKIVDAEGKEIGEMFNQVFVQKMSAQGEYTTVYGYCPAAGGWNVNFEPIAKGDVKFDAGSAVYVDKQDWDGGDVYFQVSGEVDLAPKYDVTTSPLVLLGNATPVTVDLTQIEIVFADGTAPEEMFNQVFVQRMSAEGEYTTVYGYCPAAGGWNINFEPISADTVVLQAGDALYVDSQDWDGEPLYMKLPSPVK